MRIFRPSVRRFKCAAIIAEAHCKLEVAFARLLAPRYMGLGDLLAPNGDSNINLLT